MMGIVGIYFFIVFTFGFFESGDFLVGMLVGGVGVGLKVYILSNTKLFLKCCQFAPRLLFFVLLKTAPFGNWEKHLKKLNPLESHSFFAFLIIPRRFLP